MKCCPNFTCDSHVVFSCGIFVRASLWIDLRAFHIRGRGFDSQQQLLNLTRTQSCEKIRTSQRSAESREFSSGTLITPENEIHSFSFLRLPNRRIVEKLRC